MESPSSLSSSEQLHAAGDPSQQSDPSPASSEAASLADAGRDRARYKLMSPAKLPISRSPCITIPPGLSPTSFLDSPILLSNMKAEPSPTTGSLFKPQPVPCSANSLYTLMGDCSGAKHSDDIKSNFFEFKPHMLTDRNSADFNQNIIQVRGQCAPQTFAPLPSDTQERGNSNNVAQANQSEHKVSGSCDDGYNWRKYGQKLVKGSEFPRSYYKCTHPNCEVKKLFERSHDGKISEIIYKGTHDHPKPQPSRRYSAGTVMPVQEDKSDNASLDRPSNIYMQMADAIDPDAAKQSSHAINDDTVGGVGSLSQRMHEEVDDNDDDSLSKRRKMDIDGVDVTAVVKPIREPRVVVQTVSEVDILDDGYRWRKYGQKVVRGNPNPRSYYKCTHVGCPVRKHVERASHDPKAVITTYEGKHNHDVPAGKVSSYETAGPMIPSGPSRIRSEGSESISLDLGVGISAAVDNRSNEPPQTFPEVLQHQPNNDNSNFKVVHAIPVSKYYGVLSSNVHRYGPQGNQNEGRSVDTVPSNHSNPYPQNMGRIVSGP